MAYIPVQSPFNDWGPLPARFPMLSNAQASSVARTLIEITQVTNNRRRPQPSDLRAVLSAYSVRSPIRVNMGISQQAALPAPRLKFTPQVGRDLSRPWPAGLAARNQVVNNAFPRYRLYIFIHQHKPQAKYNHDQPNIIYSISVIDRANSTLNWYDFHYENRAARMDEVRTWWTAATAQFTGSPALNGPAWPAFGIPPANTVLHPMTSLYQAEEFSHADLLLKSTMYSVIGVALHVMNSIMQPVIVVPNTLAPAAGLQLTLLPQMFESLYYILWQQNPATLRFTRLPGNAHSTPGVAAGTWVHNQGWVTNNFGIQRRLEGSVVYTDYLVYFPKEKQLRTAEWPMPLQVRRRLQVPMFVITMPT
ncbi:hypothetical protein BJ170DRAFT_737422 [Xylariales sp. AK1849]|nr:hypothetical protein BJ170DRAFT_737422 [Xylariales sp. AK1849]